MSAIPDPAWARALLAARLLACDPHGLGGARLAGPPGPARERWLAELRAHSPAGAKLRRIPARIPDERLLGGLDLEATLAAGARVARGGVLAEADGGIVLIAMAETLPPATAAKICMVLDAGTATAEREGVSTAAPARIGVVAFDEAEPDETPLAPALRERLAFDVDLAGLRVADAPPLEPDPMDQAASAPAADEATIGWLCAAAAALGVDSARAPLFALRVARALAAREGVGRIDAEHARVAAELVLAPRATRLPVDETPASESPPEPPSDSAPPDAGPPDESPSSDTTEKLDDRVLAAATAAIPPGLLARLQAGAAGRVRGAGGRSGGVGKSGARGRPAGTMAGDPKRSGARLDLIATLRAAAPWQRLRATSAGEPDVSAPRVRVRHGDFRVRRLKPRAVSTTIFALDASGSSALHRMAEAKGAVELMLAECYVRRDRVAVLAFRGRGAELVLPPTRSLVRAKRALAGLPGGGGTPIASALDAAAELVAGVRRQGGTPNLVVLTDGRANVARDGTGGREAATAQALDAAKALRALGARAVLIDTAARPSPDARALGEALGALYLPLPQADARALDRAIKAGLG